LVVDVLLLVVVQELLVVVRLLVVVWQLEVHFELAHFEQLVVVLLPVLAVQPLVGRDMDCSVYQEVGL